MSIFTKIQIKKPKRSAFNLSHEKKYSMNMGDLVPNFLQEVLPGDKFQIRSESLVRFQALLSPLMHRVDVTQHFFFVPYRLIWSEWEDFITGGEDGTASPVFPTLSANNSNVNVSSVLGVGTLADYLGFPSLNVTSSDSIEPFNALPFRAYQLIYNEYYRDQNLTDPIELSKSSGNTGLVDITSNVYRSQIWRLRRRAWEKDYFTSALPWPQRGPSVDLPVGDSAPLIAEYEGQKFPVNVGDGEHGDNSYIESEAPAGSDLFADLENATATTINDLRRAYRLQEWLEKNARGGARYIEQIFSHFGVKSSDARLQRPEYLGGSKNPVMVSEVLQHSQSTSDSALGTMGGHGVSAFGSKPIKRFFEEHGLVMGIISVTPKPAYMQGMPKLFLKNDKFDFFWPEFAHLGEQEIKNQELYYDPSDTDYNNKTFGYTPRYAEYRYVPSTVHGDMLTSLDYWHLAMKFDQQPNLNKKFIECNPRGNIFAVDPSIQDSLIIQTYHDFKAVRPMPKYANPIL